MSLQHSCLLLKAKLARAGITLGKGSVRFMIYESYTSSPQFVARVPPRMRFGAKSCGKPSSAVDTLTLTQSLPLLKSSVAMLYVPIWAG